VLVLISIVSLEAVLADYYIDVNPDAPMFG
jgi:hypothetical protein